jgi:hypothetical protein
LPGPSSLPRLKTKVDPYCIIFKNTGTYIPIDINILKIIYLIENI